MRITAVLLFFLALSSSALAQNTICPTAPSSDDSNRCASTAFVHNVAGGLGYLTGPGSSVPGDIAVWNNATGSNLRDTPPLDIFGTVTANEVFAGPSSGSPAFPAFRSLTGADVPFVVEGPASSTAGDIAVWNNTAGTLLKDTPPLDIFGTVAANTVLAGPTSGGNAFPTFRALTSGDLPAGETPGGSNTDVQFNNSSAFGGDAGFTYAGNGQATLALGTFTSNVKALAITGTWNNGAVTFDAPLYMSIGNDAAGIHSLMFDFVYAGSSVLVLAPNYNGTNFGPNSAAGSPFFVGAMTGYVPRTGMETATTDRINMVQ